MSSFILNAFYCICVICIICWIYYTQFHSVEFPQVFLDDYIDSFNTGDMILFKAYNNFNSVLHGSYYGHIGIVYMVDIVNKVDNANANKDNVNVDDARKDNVNVDNARKDNSNENADADDKTHTKKKSIPYLFETNGIEYMSLRSHHSNRGVFFTPLKERIQKYKGKCFVKKLNVSVNDEQKRHFKSFINFALNHMYYDYDLLQSSIRKKIGVESYSLGVNCGTLAFLSLISLGLLPYEMLDMKILHHLMYVSKLTDLKNASYYQQLQIVDHPFRD